MNAPRDFRHALGSLARRPAFSATIALTLALAFSIPAVVLGTVDRHFWRPLDPTQSERLFTMQIQFDDGRFSPLSHPEYVVLRDAGTEAFSLATFGQFDFTLVAGGAPMRANVALVSGNFFSVLRALPVHGRLLARSDHDSGAAAVAVVSQRAWTTRFGRDPGLVGRTVRLGPRAFTVVGVAPNPLSGPAHEPEFWVPMRELSQLLPDSAAILLGPAARWLYTAGRLRPSMSRSGAEVLATLARERLPADVAAARPEDWRFVARPINHARLGPEYHREAARFLALLALITGVFLLAACGNLVLLLLTRGAEEADELVVRRALGASRLALVRPLAAELLILVGAGVLAAVMLLRWVEPVVSALPQLAPLGPPESLHTGGLLWILPVAGAACVTVCLGLLLMTTVQPPALPRAPGPRVTSRGGRQARLAAVQVAVSCVLVVAAGLLLRSAHGVVSAPSGFVPQDVLVAQLHTAGYSEAEGYAFYRRLLDELPNSGLVTSAALGWHSPLSIFHLSVAVETPEVATEVSGNVVSKDYFHTLGIAVLEGREFTSEDHAESAPVAVVSRSLAERFWPGRPAVGRVLTFPRSGGDRTVIGVVDDVRYGALTEPARPLAYLPLAQRFFPRAFVHVRSPADPGVTLQHIRRVLADLDPAVPLSDVSTLSERVERALDRWRAPALLASLLALVTVLLAMSGLYGVVMLTIAQRARELAIRVALGAREASIRWMVLVQGMRLVAVGALIGLAAAVPLTRLLASQLYGIAPHDPTTLGVSLIGLLLAGGLACDVPARRAARLDTASALRRE